MSGSHGVGSDDVLETAIQELLGAGGNSVVNITNFGDLLIHRLGPDGRSQISVVPPDEYGIGNGTLTFSGSAYSNFGTPLHLVAGGPCQDVVFQSGTRISDVDLAVEFGGDLVVEPGAMIGFEEGVYDSDYRMEAVGSSPHTLRLEGEVVPQLTLIGGQEGDTFIFQRNSIAVDMDGRGGSDVYEIIQGDQINIIDSGPSTDRDEIVFHGSDAEDTGTSIVIDGGEPVRYENIESVILLPTFGDFDDDGQVTAADIDALLSAITAGETAPQFDLNADQRVDDHDVEMLVTEILHTRFGDADLSGSVTIPDLDVLAVNFGKDNRRWTDGDFDGDGVVQFSDQVILADNFGFERGLRTFTPSLSGRLVRAARTSCFAPFTLRAARWVASSWASRRPQLFETGITQLLQADDEMGTYEQADLHRIGR